MRKPRILVEGAWYHVSARVNRGEFCLDHDAVRDLFLAILARAKRRYRFRVIDSCVMGNHAHPLMQPGRHGGHWHERSGNMAVLDLRPPWIAFMIGLRQELQLISTGPSSASWG
jgi:hypothetical protein